YVLLLLVIATSADLGIRLWVFAASARIPFGDKVGHMVLAGLLSFLLNSALRCRAASLAGVRILIGNMIAYFLVLTEELSQLWMALRNVDIYDVLFALVGIHLFGVLASRHLRTGRQLS
ncbi:VanZ family protein, partial [Verrucomicrobiota bacterium]